MMMYLFYFEAGVIRNFRVALFRRTAPPFRKNAFPDYTIKMSN